MNLLNYIDRYSFFAVGTQIKRDLTIDDKWYGVLGGSFMIVYTLVSPLMGWLGDRYNRRMLLAGGVGLWSLATVGTAFSADFYHMFFWRALLGVGEASYGVIAPALLADLFAVEKRGRAMGIYYLALPIGTALGFIIAGRVCLSLGLASPCSSWSASRAAGGPGRAAHPRSRHGVPPKGRHTPARPIDRDSAIMPSCSRRGPSSSTRRGWPRPRSPRVPTPPGARRSISGSAGCL